MRSLSDARVTGRWAPRTRSLAGFAPPQSSDADAQAICYLGILRTCTPEPRLAVQSRLTEMTSTAAPRSVESKAPDAVQRPRLPDYRISLGYL
jgi:hypothetical protein